MAKYLTEFNTYADYSGATLELPNVSLIKSTGQVFYKNIYAGAVAGDVLMWDVANSVFKMTFLANWDATTYPIADYVPIAVNAIPANETSDGVARWISVNNMSGRWGNSGTTIGGIDNQDVLSGRNYTDTVLNYTGYSASAYVAFNNVNTFVTSGTSAGDWFMPSLGELKLAYTHKTIINTNLSAINAASSTAASALSGEYMSSTENGANFIWNLNFTNGSTIFNSKKANGGSFRAFIML